MKAVIQEETTGCAIASVAAIAGISYAQARNMAGSMAIYAKDSALWSETRYIRMLLSNLGFDTSPGELLFTHWASLPDCALLSIKWHKENGKPFWHWAVFVREDDCEYVLDFNKNLKSNIRTDFGRMKPRWYIKVKIEK